MEENCLNSVFNRAWSLENIRREISCGIFSVIISWCVCQGDFCLPHTRRFVEDSTEQDNFHEQEGAVWKNTDSLSPHSDSRLQSDSLQPPCGPGTTETADSIFSHRFHTAACPAWFTQTGKAFHRPAQFQAGSHKPLPERAVFHCQQDCSLLPCLSIGRISQSSLC